MSAKAVVRRKSPGRESREARQERALGIDRRLAEAYPDADCELDHRTPWELLVATILSAQCTDKMVNQVTPALFDEFPDARSIARAPEARLESLIRKTGFFNQKSRALRACAREIVERHGGRVPDEIDVLVGLPGVGRKTASVVAGTAFGKPAVFVDTHVKRLSSRLGLTRNEEPDRIESDLKTVLPPPAWTRFCHRLIHHGRRICIARAPACSICPLRPLCPQIGVDKRSAR